MARNFRNGVPVTVTISGFSGLRYGFLSRLREGLYDNFGQTRLYAGLANVQGIVFGANSPKPARASKLETTGYEGSFCDATKIQSLKDDGYQVTRPKRPRRPISTTRSQTYYVTINGIKYAWNKATATEEPANLVATTGIKLADANETGLVWGASFPKPPKAKFQISAGTYSTFCDPSNQAQVVEAGIFDDSKAFYTQEQLSITLPASG